MALLGGVYLDIVYSDNVSRTAKTTDHPIEDGSSISDHAENDPDEVSISGVCTGPDAVKRLTQLNDYKKSRKLLSYTYRTGYQNVIITNFKSTHDAEVKGGFKFELSLKQIKIAKPAIITDVSVVTAAVAEKGLQQPTADPVAKIYTVKSGDSLSKIGANYGVNWRSIYDKNKGVIGNNPNAIYPGQQLIIPA